MFNLILDAISYVPKMPSGVWPSIINWVQSFTQSYGWTIILITVVLKLIMLPLDYWMKLSQKKMTNATKLMQPELEAINKRYGYDKTILNQKQSEVYKKHGVNPMGSCLPMVINLAVIFTVFITLINSLTSMANYKMEDQFFKLQNIYNQTYEQTYNELYNKPEQIVEGGDETETPTEPEEPIISEEEKAAIEQATKKAEDAVVEAYKNKNSEIRNSFLWIKNIWRKDTHESVIPAYKDAAAGYNKDIEKASEFYKVVTEEEYNKIMTPLINSYGKAWNGYYILLIITVGVTVLNAFIMQLDNKKNKTQNLNKSNWTTQIIMIGISGVFCFISSSTFALYLATSQVISVLSQLVVNPLVNLTIKNQKPKNKNGKGDNNKNNNDPTKISYSRY